MLDSLIEQSGLPREQLLDEVQAVHRRHGTSEYAFLIEELPSLRRLHPGSDLNEVYRTAVEARRRARNQSLRLYPGVRETLTALREQGTVVVGYTESMAYYSSTRVRKLGLDGLLSVLYSPADHELPRGLTREQVRRHPEEHYQLTRVLHRHTPPGELKPNPKLLIDIIRDLRTTVSEVAYVGDSPMKDVAMAQDAGVADVLALYGKAQDRAAYELLRRVTHWTPEDVEREKAILQRGDIRPTFILSQSFDELTNLFDFVPSSRETLTAIASRGDSVAMID